VGGWRRWERGRIFNGETVIPRLATFSGQSFRGVRRSGRNASETYSRDRRRSGDRLADVQGCQIFSGYNIPKRGKIYQMTAKYTKWP
jgi:hypothetical protein